MPRNDATQAVRLAIGVDRVHPRGVARHTYSANCINGLGVAHRWAIAATPASIVSAGPLTVGGASSTSRWAPASW